MQHSLKQVIIYQEKVHNRFIETSQVNIFKSIDQEIEKLIEMDRCNATTSINKSMLDQKSLMDKTLQQKSLLDKTLQVMFDQTISEKTFEKKSFISRSELEMTQE